MIAVSINDETGLGVAALLIAILQWLFPRAPRGRLQGRGQRGVAYSPLSSWLHLGFAYIGPCCGGHRGYRGGCLCRPSSAAAECVFLPKILLASLAVVFLMWHVTAALLSITEIQSADVIFDIRPAIGAGVGAVGWMVVVAAQLMD